MTREASPARLCPYCRSAQIAEERCESGPHYAKLVCLDCRRFLRWLPRPPQGPAGPSAEVLAMIHARERPTPLLGPPRQIAAAIAIRSAMVERIRRSGHEEWARLLACIRDASWFLANRNRPPGAIRWPSPAQVEDPTPTGVCVNCGESTFDGESCCSDRCVAEYAIFCGGHATDGNEP